MIALLVHELWHRDRHNLCPSTSILAKFSNPGVQVRESWMALHKTREHQVMLELQMLFVVVVLFFINKYTSNPETLMQQSKKS